MTDRDRNWVAGMAEAYDHGLVATVFAPFADKLARRVAQRSPHHVLELGAGSGALTAALLEHTTAAVTATDLSDAMVAVGQANAPGASWRQADATALPFEDASFDAVAAQFSVMFFPDKPAAFSEVRRCLVEDGAFVFNTWGALEEHDFQSAVVAGLADIFGDTAPAFMSAVPHGYHDFATVEADLRAADFELRDTTRTELVGRAASARALAEGYCLGTPIRSAVAERGMNMDDVIAAVANAMRARLGDGPIEGRMVALVFEAAAPA